MGNIKEPDFECPRCESSNMTLENNSNYETVKFGCGEYKTIKLSGGHYLLTCNDCGYWRAEAS